MPRTRPSIEPDGQRRPKVRNRCIPCQARRRRRSRHLGHRQPTLLLPPPTKGLQHDDTLHPQTAEITASSTSRGDRIRTCDIRLPKPGEGVAGDGSGAQVVGSIGGGSGCGVQRVQADAGLSKSFAAPVLPGADGERLLSVREVATRLGVSTATIYKLCERGELVHVRVLNAIRVRPADLSAFGGGCGTG